MRGTNEIPKERWADYLNALSNRLKNHPVEVRIEGHESGDQPLSSNLPLLGISCEKKGSEADAIEISLAGQDLKNMTHLVEHPERIYVQEADNGEVACLDIEDRAKVKTLIFFSEYAELPAGK